MKTLLRILLALVPFGIVCLALAMRVLPGEAFGAGVAGVASGYLGMLIFVVLESRLR